jgi:hypothetical protein
MIDALAFILAIAFAVFAVIIIVIIVIGILAHRWMFGEWPWGDVQAPADDEADELREAGR